MTKQEPIIDSELILHRGASAYAPENTLESLHLAADMGAKWIETDVRITKDDHLVMIHDTEVDRTTDGAGRVSLMQLSDIRELDAGGWFSGRYRGALVPTLEEYLTAIQERKLGLVLELKDEPGWEERLTHYVAKIVKDIWTSDPKKLVISAFAERCLKASAELLPEFPRCAAVSAVPEDPANRLTESRAHMLHLQYRFGDDESLERLKMTGIEFGFATVNNADRARYLLNKGASSILTDKPDLLDVK